MHGAGKTTASFSLLPEILNCKEFANTDEIAKGLSPFQPEQVAIDAGRLMLKRIDELIENNKNFALETTLATKSYKNRILLAKKQGYHVILVYYWLQDSELAIERVKQRVKEGGHNIESEIIKRRYLNGIKNFFNIYFSIVDEILLFDNSDNKSDFIAEKKNNSTELTVYKTDKFLLFKKYYNEN